MWYKIIKCLTNARRNLNSTVLFCLEFMWQVVNPKFQTMWLSVAECFFIATNRLWIFLLYYIIIDSMLALHIHILPQREPQNTIENQHETEKGRQRIPSSCCIFLLENNKLRNTYIGSEELNFDIFNNFGATQARS